MATSPAVLYAALATVVEYAGDVRGWISSGWYSVPDAARRRHGVADSSH